MSSITARSPSTRPAKAILVIWTTRLSAAALFMGAQCGPGAVVRGEFGVRACVCGLWKSRVCFGLSVEFDGAKALRRLEKRVLYACVEGRRQGRVWRLRLGRRKKTTGDGGVCPASRLRVWLLEREDQRRRGSSRIGEVCPVRLCVGRYGKSSRMKFGRRRKKTTGMGVYALQYGSVA